MALVEYALVAIILVVTALGYSARKLNRRENAFLVLQTFQEWATEFEGTGMNAIFRKVDREPGFHGACRLSGIGEVAWSSDLFCRLAWECQDRRSAAWS